MVYFIIIIVLLCLMSMSYCIGYRHGEEDQIEEQERSKNDLRSYVDDTTSNLIKFRTFSHRYKAFSYTPSMGDLQQFIGILDKNLKQIYEKDVVKGIYGLEGIEVIGEVWYNNNCCAYHIGDYGIYNIELDSLEIIGNMDQDFIYNEKGELEKKYE